MGSILLVGSKNWTPQVFNIGINSTCFHNVLLHFLGRAPQVMIYACTSVWVCVRAPPWWPDHAIAVSHTLTHTGPHKWWKASTLTHTGPTSNGRKVHTPTLLSAQSIINSLFHTFQHSMFIPNIKQPCLVILSFWHNLGSIILIYLCLICHTLFLTKIQYLFLCIFTFKRHFFFTLFWLVVVWYHMILSYCQCQI